MFDVDVDVAANDRARPSLGPQRRHNRRSRFPPSLSGAEADTGEIDHSIANSYLQHGLKRHPFTLTRKAQVHSLFLFQLSNLNV